MTHQALLLVVAVIAVGVLHTLVPDHWVPIALLARTEGWSRIQTARAAFFAGLGHTLSTLAIGAIVWFAGAAVALKFGHLVSLASSLALIAFGGWIAVASLREARENGEHGHTHGHDHAHGHAHDDQSRGMRSGSSRTTLLLILGSSPMIEGIPTFFAAAKFGWMLVLVMSALFALSTIATYVTLCVLSDGALRRLSLGPLEAYGEVISGAFIAVVGLAFLIWPIG